MKINNKDIFCLIPARGGSKRLKNKNIKMLKKKPLVWYSINFAKKIKKAHILLSTDSKKIYKICSKFIKVEDLRPKSLANDLTTTFKSKLGAFMISNSPFVPSSGKSLKNGFGKWLAKQAFPPLHFQ